jgi:hypothetical protein
MGRWGFEIHADNPDHDTSQGCIILPKDAREKIRRSKDRRLVVMDIMSPKTSKKNKHKKETKRKQGSKKGRNKTVKSGGIR